MVTRSLQTLLSLFAVLTASCFHLLGFAQPIPGVSDEILAVVNGEPILKSELVRRARFQMEEYKRQKIEPPSDTIFRNQILENAVMDKLVLQAAQQNQSIPEPSVVMSVAQTNAAKAGLSFEQFKDKLAQSSVSIEEYLSDLRNEIAISRTRERAISERLKITDTEVDRFLRNPNSGLKQEFNVSHITLSKKETASISEVNELRVQISKLRDQILNGASFELLAKQFSTVQDASKGGEMGFRTLDKYPEIYSLTLETMVTGDISGVLETSAGFHLLKVNAIRLETPSAQQILARHILIKVDENTSEELAHSEIKKIHSMLVLNKDRFPELAKKYGQDGTAQNEGSLGWSLPGDMVAEFETVMERTPIGQISEPLRTQFGWHVLQVLDKQLRPVSRERMRSQAKFLIRQNKIEEISNEWLRELRAKAFIEYKKR